MFFLSALAPGVSIRSAPTGTASPSSSASVLQKPWAGAVEQEGVAERREAGVERGGIGGIVPPILPILSDLSPAGGGQEPDQELARASIQIGPRPVEGDDRVVPDP